MNYWGEPALTSTTLIGTMHGLRTRNNLGWAWVSSTYTWKIIVGIKILKIVCLYICMHVCMCVSLAHNCHTYTCSWGPCTPWNAQCIPLYWRDSRVRLSTASKDWSYLSAVKIVDKDSYSGRLSGMDESKSGDASSSKNPMYRLHCLELIYRPKCGKCCCRFEVSKCNQTWRT